MIKLPENTEPLWLQGDVLDRLAEIPDDSIQCVVCSPPYWGLRNYDTAEWVGVAEGYEGCKHDEKTIGHEMQGAKDVCLKCGAVLIDKQIGLEPTLQEWLDKMVEVFREVRRVLRPDGTLWLNIGDAYAHPGKGSKGDESRHQHLHGTIPKHLYPEQANRGKYSGFKPKDCLMMDYRLALALQADGWWVRSKIVWAKPNPMPESVTDRPTSSHEMIFLLTKSARYYYDADAIREGYSEATIERLSQPTFDSQTGGPKDPKTGNRSPRKAMENLKRSWDKAADADRGELVQRGRGKSGPATTHELGRNSRNVWTIATHPNPKAHFACVDSDTECLTANGWKRYNEIKIGEDAAQFNIETGLLSWGKIEDIAIYEVENQEMVEGYSRDLRVLLTPNHRCVIFRRHPKSGLYKKPVVIRADELKPGHRIPTAAHWEDVGVNAVPGVWAELLGWYISEGHQCKNSSSVEIYQSETANKEKCQRIEYLLNATEIEWVKAAGRRTWRGKESISVAYKIRGYGALRLRELAPDKILQTDILRWNTVLCEALLSGLIGGDGHTRIDGRMCYVQKGKAAIDLVHALAIRCGYSACVSERMAPGDLWTCYLTKHRVRSFRGTAGKGDNLKTVIYSGIAWCPKLPKGTWVARRQGRVFITGNTFPPELVRRCVAAGTSEKGCCPKCGKPWGRVVEHQKAISRTTDKINADRNDAGLTQFVGASSKTLGWRPGCDCLNEHGRYVTTPKPVPCIVLDIFAGIGTALAVAARMGRRSIGIELNPEYIEIGLPDCEAAFRGITEQEVLAGQGTLFDDS